MIRQRSRRVMVPEKLSEKPLLGTAVMGYGNFTLGKEATLCMSRGKR
ncbi:hypothetical protein [Sphingobacterium thalpophilum]